MWYVTCEVKLALFLQCTAFLQACKVNWFRWHTKTEDRPLISCDPSETHWSRRRFLGPRNYFKYAGALSPSQLVKPSDHIFFVSEEKGRQVYTYSHTPNLTNVIQSQFFLKALYAHLGEPVIQCVAFLLQCHSRRKVSAVYSTVHCYAVFIWIVSLLVRKEDLVVTCRTSNLP